MNFLKKSLKFILVCIALVIALLYITDTDYLIKAVRTIYLKGHSTAYLEDYKKFDNQVIEAGTPQPWSNHIDYNTMTISPELEKANQDWGTIAYVIIKNDSIWFEKYYDGLKV
jgi:hypothetical protein